MHLYLNNILLVKNTKTLVTSTIFFLLFDQIRKEYFINDGVNLTD